MHRRVLSLALAGFLAIVIFNWSCTKLDTTTLGSDLLPEVDNVHTFADTLDLITNQFDYTDTTIVTKADDHVIGKIDNDPVFGKTYAEAYFQLKPSYYPFLLGNRNRDSLVGLDSVILCLSYSGFWGDSNQIQKLQVFEINDPAFRDSLEYGFPVSTPAFSAGTLIGEKNVDIRRMADSIYFDHHKDSVNYQIRFKLDAAFANRLYNSDSALSGSGNHAFNSDSIFRHEFNGFAIKPSGPGNNLIYTSLSSPKTRLEIHYRIKVPGNKIDTTFESFILNTSSVSKMSATANLIKRDRAGTPSTAPSSDEIYLQTQPGTFATIEVPELNNYPNRIIHRAELVVKQIPENPLFDTLYSPPRYLYLDLKEPGTSLPAKYKPIYIDLNPSSPYDPDYSGTSVYFPAAGVDLTYYGGYERKMVGPAASMITYYNINITRYLQKMVKEQSTNYIMRLFPAFNIRYSQYQGKTNYVSNIAYANSAARGRIKIGSGTNQNYKMYIRIIYSNIK